MKANIASSTSESRKDRKSYFSQKRYLKIFLTLGANLFHCYRRVKVTMSPNNDLANIFSNNVSGKEDRDKKLSVLHYSYARETNGLS